LLLKFPMNRYAFLLFIPLALFAGTTDILCNM
jgi:hypothetical protein